MTITAFHATAVRAERVTLQTTLGLFNDRCTKIVVFYSKLRHVPEAGNRKKKGWL